MFDPNAGGQIGKRVGGLNIGDGYGFDGGAVLPVVRLHCVLPSGITPLLGHKFFKLVMAISRNASVPSFMHSEQTPLIIAEPFNVANGVAIISNGGGLTSAPNSAVQSGLRHCGLLSPRRLSHPAMAITKASARGS